MAEPNVMLLDEPTNDLDIETLTSLEDVLDGWAGTLLVVSHDRYLLERVTDRQVALLGDGQVRDLPGGVEQYLQLLGERGRYAVPVDAAPRRTRSRPKRPGPTAARGPRGPQGAGPGRESRWAGWPNARSASTPQMAEQASDHAAVLALNDKLRASSTSGRGWSWSG